MFEAGKGNEYLVTRQFDPLSSCLPFKIKKLDLTPCLKEGKR